MKLNCTTKLPPKLRKHVIAHTKYTVETIFTKRQQAKLQSISIRLDRSMTNAQDINVDTMPLAYMDIDIKDEEDFNRPTNFILWINPLFTKKNLSGNGRTVLAETIVHELAHVKQHVSGAMKQICKNGSMLIKFNKKMYNVRDSDNYWLYPWEIEARGYERGVLNLYCIKYSCFKMFPENPI